MNMLNTTHALKINVENTDSLLENKLKTFWDLETIGIHENEKSNLENYLEEIKVSNDGRYEVRLPFKASHPILPDNFNSCEKRVKSKLSKLKKSPELLIKYDNVFKEQKSSGIIEEVSDPGTAGQVHYLPNHEVVREDKNTTKLRIVFDASSNQTGESLNNCLDKGPQLTPLLYDILLRFRQYPIALTADIEKAFLQIRVAEEDRNYLRFLWFEDVFKDEPIIVRNRFARVVFGVNSSPFLLNGTIFKHMDQFIAADQDFVNKVIESFFVDDFIGGEFSIERAIELYKKLKLRFMQGHFLLRKWRTNDSQLRETIQSLENDPEYESKPAKILGLAWDEINDVLSYDLTAILEAALKVPPTKRNVLSVLSSIYDPIGLIQPLTVTLKLFFQELCKLKLKWDDELPLTHKKQWQNIIKNLMENSVIEVARQYVTNSIKDPVVYHELHRFSDASPAAYGANVYLLAKTESGKIQVSLVSSKSRVSPIHRHTIPRTELLGNLLLSRLISSVKNALKGHIEFREVHYWTDSKICLAWINAQTKEFKTFVQNRLDEIRKLTEIKNWHYCPTDMNPADLITRQSMTPSDLIKNLAWWQGPKYLQFDRKDWYYGAKIENLDNEFNNEVKLSTNTNLVTSSFEISIGDSIDINRYSNYLRLLRVTAWVLRFTNNIKSKQGIRTTSYITKTYLNCDELSSAEKLWIQENQLGFRADSNFETLKCQLNVKLDENGIYRCYGRLQNAPMEFESRFPILLNKRNKLTELIITTDIHVRHKHVLAKQTLTELRKKFWIAKGRSLVRKILNGCRVCRKFDGKPYSYPETPPLTELRLNNSRPFAVAGVDLFGPLFVKNVYSGDLKVMHKAWVGLYTCAASRSVVLDLMRDPSARSFIESFRRFVARRGCPDNVISDNGSNFTATETQEFISKLNVSWHFNIPMAPWYGGFFERLVRIIKTHLKKQLGNSRLTYDEIQTMLLEIEMIVNNRPITYCYADELEQCLTPNHLLYARRLESESLTTNNISYHAITDYSKFTDRLSQILNHFWNRWKTEYLSELTQLRSKSKANNKPLIQINDIVLIHEDLIPRLRWRVGKVEELIYSTDSQVRGAVVRIPNSQTLKRPINKLYAIETAVENYSPLKNNIENVENPKSTGDDNKDTLDNSNSNSLRRSKREAAKLAELKMKFADEANDELL